MNDDLKQRLITALNNKTKRTSVVYFEVKCSNSNGDVVERRKIKAASMHTAIMRANKQLKDEGRRDIKYLAADPVAA